MVGDRKFMTAGDYAAIAFCPAMIVLMLSALVHFLILCIYRGEFSTRLTYILFMFIMGATGIARISVEFGRAHAGMYAAALGLATVFVLAQFSNLFFALSMVLIIWFLADHITYDCTVIEEDDRASGEGLLGTGKWFGPKRTATPVDLRLDGTTAESLSPSDSDSRSKKRRKQGRHKPGRSVFWLALASLPLFGVGQLILPDQPDLERRALLALACYLFATLMLLVTTSFLGLRSYLRARGAEMPNNVAIAWICGGLALTLLLLVLCFALPAPGRAIAALELPAALESPDWLSPHRWGWGSEPAEPAQSGAGSRESGAGSRESGASGGEQAGGEQSGGEQAGGEQAGGEQAGGEQAGGEQAGGEQSGGEQSGGEQSGGEQAGGEQAGGEQSGGEQSGGEQSGGEQEDSNQRESAEQSGGEQADSNQRESAEQSQQPPQTDSTAAHQEQNSPPTETGSPTPDSQLPTPNSPTPDSQLPTPNSPTPDSSTPDSPTPDWLPQLSTLLKWLIGLVLIGILLWFLVRNRAMLVAMWAAFVDYWKNLQRQAGMAEDAADPAIAPRVYRSFASFRDPAGENSDPRQTVVITFQALEAWSREAAFPRRDDETPSEFSVRLGREYPLVGAELTRLATAYNRVVYGRRGASAGDLRACQRLWQWMRSSSEAGPVISVRS